MAAGKFNIRQIIDNAPLKGIHIRVLLIGLALALVNGLDNDLPGRRRLDRRSGAGRGAGGRQLSGRDPRHRDRLDARRRPDWLDHQPDGGEHSNEHGLEHRGGPDDPGDPGAARRDRHHLRPAFEPARGRDGPSINHLAPYQIEETSWHTSRKPVERSRKSSSKCCAHAA